MNTSTPALSDPTPSRRVSPWWRALSVLLVLVLLLGWAASASLYEQLKAQIAHLQKKVTTVPQIRDIAVLLDKDGAPAMLVTMDPGSGQLQLQRLNEVKEGREDSMQLWAVAEGQAPRSLGVIESRFKTMQLPATPTSLDGAAELAISVENKGGVAESKGPSLPWLFKGALVRKAM
ncbi:MAG: anti-sigma factor [Hydrogenophaga sp.]|nr:anti-sigma factor [Hydrogenophaga sp.]